MPIPKPQGSETEEKYISRCISDIASEYDVEGQAYAVCKGTYDRDKMSKIKDTASKVMARIVYDTKYKGTERKNMRVGEQKRGISDQTCCCREPSSVIIDSVQRHGLLISLMIASNIPLRNKSPVVYSLLFIPYFTYNFVKHYMCNICCVNTRTYWARLGRDRILFGYSISQL